MGLVAFHVMTPRSSKYRHHRRRETETKEKYSEELYHYHRLLELLQLSLHFPFIHFIYITNSLWISELSQILLFQYLIIKLMLI